MRLLISDLQYLLGCTLFRTVMSKHSFLVLSIAFSELRRGGAGGRGGGAGGGGEGGDGVRDNRYLSIDLYLSGLVESELLTRR